MARKLKATDKQIDAKKKRSAVEVERRVTHSLNHPVRLDALSILIERVSSPKEIAHILGVTVGAASFHVGELFADDVIELVEIKQRRGAVEHFYKAKLRPEITDEEWRRMSAGTRREMAGLLFRAVVAEGLSSMRHGKMDTDDDLYIGWKVVPVDVKGKQELTKAQLAMQEQVEDIRTRSESRIAAGKEALSVRVVAVMGFERGRPGDEPHGDSLDKSILKPARKRSGKKG